jgi:hypothetical protein
MQGKKNHNGDQPQSQQPLKYSLKGRNEVHQAATAESK